MELTTLIEDVSRQRSHLEILKSDPAIDVESLAKCDYLVTEISYSLDDLAKPWIPTEPETLTSLFARTVDNINGAREAISDGISFVDPSKADHLLRLKLGLLAIDILDFMLEKLVLAMAKHKPETVN